MLLLKVHHLNIIHFLLLKLERKFYNIVLELINSWHPRKPIAAPELCSLTLISCVCVCFLLENGQYRIGMSILGYQPPSDQETYYKKNSDGFIKVGNSQAFFLSWLSHSLISATLRVGDSNSRADLLSFYHRTTTLGLLVSFVFKIICTQSL